jgi:carbon-monoxide dehydrogenase medium subunit
MRIRPFSFHNAKSVDEAFEILDRYAPDVKVLAGGTDLVLALKEKKLSPAHVMNILDIGDLERIRDEEGQVRIGALARHASVAGDASVTRGFPILAEACGGIGSWQIRNMATIGGNLCNASPAADSAPPLLALDARVIVADSTGEKEYPIGEFFRGPGATVVSPNQLLKEIIVPKAKGRSAGTYLKLTRRKAVDLALVGVAFLCELDQKGGRIGRVAVALGGVAPTPIRAPKAEAILTGLSREEARRGIDEAARMAVEATSPISDVRASAEYRREMVRVLFKRAAEKALDAVFEGV